MTESTTTRGSWCEDVISRLYCEFSIYQSRFPCQICNTYRGIKFVWAAWKDHKVENLSPRTQFTYKTVKQIISRGLTHLIARRTGTSLDDDARSLNMVKLEKNPDFSARLSVITMLLNRLVDMMKTVGKSTKMKNYCAKRTGLLLNVDSKIWEAFVAVVIVIS